MNETGNPLEKIFFTDGTADPNTMKVNYESKRSQQNIEKKNKDMKSDAFPRMELPVSSMDSMSTVFFTGSILFFSHMPFATYR